MARKDKIDNVLLKRFERQEKKRALGTREKRVYFLIVCEGEKTEPNYFQALKKELPIGEIDLDIDGTALNTLGLVEYAQKRKENSLRTYDRVWVVFDKDSFPPDNFNNAIAKAEAYDIKCAWSNEAFELWFLLHFQFVNNAMSRDAYKAYLEREIQAKLTNTSYRYQKNDANTFVLLKKLGNQEQAILWAKKLKQNFADNRYASHNPCTRVYELILELNNPQEVLKSIS